MAGEMGYHGPLVKDDRHGSQRQRDAGNPGWGESEQVTRRVYRAQVIPFAPEPIQKQDGTKKNDCERNAAQAAEGVNQSRLPVRSFNVDSFVYNSSCAKRQLH
jgi:hypothetical protein